MSDAPKPIRGSCLCGQVNWEFRGEIADATICNCTACRRYGVLWAYDYEGHGISVNDPNGQLVSYRRGSEVLTFDFCKTCGNLVSWRRTTADADGRVRMAVNLRLAEPSDVAGIPIVRFEGLHSFKDLPMDGRTVGDVWF
ncbi:hypothetical protein DSM25559_0723 [Agrobacterium rosae]|uniref:CENP-V/GFA domain-containing protein n=2 Tax=Agrobacterium rosae TaxID=1972867 RepID=A0A1R3TBU2_9HYPH|nr:hypothetical protein DSM25559_0723 [Agrobacterium rosae]